MKIKTKFTLLTLSICLAQQSYALELIKDQELGQVVGQDGITITHEVSKITAEQVNWYDPGASKNQKMGLGLHNLKVHGIDVQNGQVIGSGNITSSLEFDVGATDAGAGLKIKASVTPFQAEADLKLVKIVCDNNPCLQEENSIRTAGTQTLQDLGSIGLTTKSAFNVVLKTTAGLFNKNEIAEIDFNLQDATLSHTLESNTLMLDNFNFNFKGKGYMYIDPNEGVVLTSNNGSDDHTIELTPVAVGDTKATTAGVNFDLRYRAGENGELKNIMRFGISGAVKNARLALSANQSKDNIANHQMALNGFDITNKNGSNYIQTDQYAQGYGEEHGGLHLNLSADFTETTTLELGHTGKDSYSVQFNELRSLTGENRPYIDFGDIYINTMTAPTVGLEYYISDHLAKTVGYKESKIYQKISTGDHTLFAIRGMDFQSIAGQANFISNETGLVSGNKGSWGIGIPIYNLNANIALSGTNYNNKQALAYNVMASTQGYGIDKVTKAPSTTSILLIDGEKENGLARNYYAGFRNIEAFLSSEGKISYEDDGILIAADKLLIAASAELAIGRLPGTTYFYESNDIRVDENSSNNERKVVKEATVALDHFSKPDDVLTNIAFKLDGKANLKIIPGVDDKISISAPNPEGLLSTNFLSLKGDFKFRPLSEYTEQDNSNNLGSYFSLSNIDVVNGSEKVSSITFSEMQGHLGLDARIRVEADKVKLDNQVKFNYSNDIAQPFRTNFAMQTNSTMQNMASIAITGGALRSNLGITPR